LPNRQAFFVCAVIFSRRYFWHGSMLHELGRQAHAWSHISARTPIHPFRLPAPPHHASPSLPTVKRRPSDKLLALFLVPFL
jgi:hypothetical protein